jgi:manganese/zinc/iron transport system substrate-binding protein
MKKKFFLLVLCLSFLCFVFLVKKFFSSKDEYTIKPTIVCSTSILADTVKNIVGDLAEVGAIMGPGIDPHLYKPSSADCYSIDKADIIIYNGLHLEGKMVQIFNSLKKRGKIIYAAEEAIPNHLLISTEYDNIHDPHIFHDVILWKGVVEYFAKVLSEYFSENKDTIEKNKASYIDKLDELHFFVKEKISEIRYSKILVTSHDAFSYFAKRYGLEHYSIQGISTDAEPTIQDTEKVLKVLSDNAVPTIFVEQTVCENYLKNIQAIMREQNKPVRIGEQLYSDALGQTAGKTYIAMIQENTRAISEGLNNYEK